MAEMVYRASCSCGWKGPARTQAERNLVLHDEEYHRVEIKRPEFHKFTRLVALVTWERL